MAKDGTHIYTQLNQRKCQIMISLQSLIHHQLSEGLTEQELAEDIGVSKFTIYKILKGRYPKKPEIWKKLARYFHMDMNRLRDETFGLANSRGSVANHAGHHKPYRKVPLLSWTQASQIEAQQDPWSLLTSRQLMIETELSGERVFAMPVRDDSMEPLFHKGEIFFVDPGLRPQDGHYVVVFTRLTAADEGCLRQLMKVQPHSILHPLNSKYKDMLLKSHQKIIGRVVRLRMDL